MVGQKSLRIEYTGHATEGSALLQDVAEASSSRHVCLHLREDFVASHCHEEVCQSVSQAALEGFR